MKHYILLVSILLSYSCVKDKPLATNNPVVQLSAAKKVYIINEGNYGSSNASVSLFDPGTKQVLENYYQSINGNALGDVAQSMSYINNKFYIVVNNSGKLFVCDADFKKTATLSGLTSPRYIQQVSNQKAYISDFKSNTVHIIDLNSNTVSGEIALSGWTERMQMIYNKVFVCNLRRSYVYTINTITDSKSDSAYVGPNAAGLVLDRNDKLWVLAAGDSSKNVLPRLTKINPISNKVESYYDFKLADKPSNLCINKGKDSLYFLNSGVFRMAVSENSLPASAFIPGNGRNYYGLGVNPNDYSVYAADALDYSQKSNIYVFDNKGNQVNFFKAGINANGFYFE